MRLFTAIGLPASVAGPLVEAARKLLPAARSAARIRWTVAANMHLTLSFLGSVDVARLEAIRQTLASVVGPRFRVTLQGAGLFAHAGVLLAKVEPSPALLALAEQVAASLEAVGIPRETRPYQPHITLARSKGLISLAPSVAGHPAIHQSFEAEEFRLYESVTRPEGAHYEVLSAYPLNPDRGPHRSASR
jgi:RNA 2',3'-cyclic 3'-phosphodiesterase